MTGVSDIKEIPFFSLRNLYVNALEEKMREIRIWLSSVGKEHILIEIFWKTNIYNSHIDRIVG